MPRRLLIALLAGLLLPGCAGFTPTFYRLDVRQGNVIEAEQLAQLQPGMSKRQAQILLGTPLVADPFREDRWDYVYLYYPSGNPDRGEQRRVTLFFEGDALSRVETDG